MKTLVRLGLVLMSPYLMVVYWRNNLREVGDLHAAYDLSYE
jgi:hypothetical protein